MSMNRELTTRENMQLVIDGKQPEWLPSFFDDCVTITPAALDRKQDKQTGHFVDIFGTRFFDAADGQVPDHSHHRLTDVTKWREVMPEIDLSKIDWEEDARLMRARHITNDQSIHLHAGFVWEQLHYMMGFEDALTALLIEPEAAYDCMNALADFWIDALRRYCKFIKPDFAVFFEHIATARGLLMSPATYRSIIKPVQKKMYSAIIELGVIPEIHVDGYIEDVIPDFVELGIRAIQPFQVMNDINLYKEKYSLTAFGGWDAFGPGNKEESTDEEIRASVRLAMDSYGPGYRYVFSGSGATARFKRHIAVMADEARIYGHAFYK